MKCIYIHSSTLNNVASLLSQVYQQGGMRHSELAVKNVAREKQRDESIVHTDVNLHWTTANVDLYVDSCLDLPHCMVISRDAKAIIPTDISPAQHPGHTWKKCLELSHHAWDQLRTNVITPMTSTV